MKEFLERKNVMQRQLLLYCTGDIFIVFFLAFTGVIPRHLQHQDQVWWWGFTEQQTASCMNFDCVNNNVSGWDIIT